MEENKDNFLSKKKDILNLENIKTNNILDYRPRNILSLPNKEEEKKKKESYNPNLLNKSKR